MGGTAALALTDPRLRRFPRSEVAHMLTSKAGALDLDIPGAIAARAGREDDAWSQLGHGAYAPPHHVSDMRLKRTDERCVPRHACGFRI